MIGREFDGRYRILSKLGEGAMGEVYLVEHMGLGRKEALKILRPSLDDSPTLVTRFRREARATNRLQHQNVVAVHDFGRLPDGRFYITTEFADGRPLDKVLAEAKSLPVARSVNLLIQLADAIDHAHSRGVIHRDLKPANLILVERRAQGDLVKVLDFGVAKIIAPDYAETIAATGQGEVFGTPAYMAPEQIGAKADDPRIDIYQFGCIACELLTGAPPFAGRTLEVMNAHLHTPPPRPSQRTPSAAVPAALDDLVLACLAKDPAMRPQTGADVSQRLAAIRAGLQAAGVVDTPAPRRHAAAASWGASELTTPDPGGRWTGFGTDPTGAASGPSETAPGIFDDGARSEARLAVDAVLIQLAEALIDQGCNDFQLTITVANIAGVRGTLDSVVARMDELDRAREAVEKRGKDSEARFRFAVGELRFELEQARQRGEANPDVEFQANELEGRMAELTAQAEREIAAIDDRAITLAADRAAAEEELGNLVATLERLVDDVAPRFRSSAAVAELSHHLARARQGLSGT